MEDDNSNATEKSDSEHNSAKINPADIYPDPLTEEERAQNKRDSEFKSAKIKKKVTISTYILAVSSFITGIYWLYGVSTYIVNKATLSAFSAYSDFLGNSYTNIVLVSQVFLSLLLLYLSYKVYKASAIALAVLTGLFISYMLPLRLPFYYGLFTNPSSFNNISASEWPQVIIPILITIGIILAWTKEKYSYA